MTSTKGKGVCAMLRRCVDAVRRRVSHLNAPMSLRDQEAVYTFANKLIVGTALVTYPVAYAMGNIFVVVGCVLAAYVVALCVCCPNWLQRDDVGVQWARREEVAAYYEQYDAAKAALRVEADGAKGSRATRWATSVLNFVHLL